MRTLLTRETLQMINIPFRSHHHLERRYQLIARRTQPGIAVQPHVVALAQQEILTRVQRGAHIAEPTIAASALQAILVPEQIERFQKIFVPNQSFTFRTEMRLIIRLLGFDDNVVVHVGSIWYM